jgi:transaldolase
MHLWIAGSIDQVLEASRTGLVSAIVTNPTVMADWTKDGKTLEDTVEYVCSRTTLPLCVQLYGPDADTYLREANDLKSISPRIMPKIPATLEGLKAVQTLESNGVQTLVTTVCSFTQAYAAAVARASVICPYIGRLNKVGIDAYQMIRSISDLYLHQSIATQIIPASVRTIEDVTHTLAAGAHGVIIFYGLFLKLFENEVMKQSLDGFEKDWGKIHRRISVQK